MTMPGYTINPNVPQLKGPPAPEQLMEEILKEAWKTTPAGRGATKFDLMGLLQAVGPGMGGQDSLMGAAPAGGGAGQGVGPGMPGPANPQMAQVPVSPVQVPQAGQMPGPMPPPPNPSFSVTPGGGAAGTAVVAGQPTGPTPAGGGPVQLPQPEFLSYEAAKKQQPDLSPQDYAMMRKQYELQQATRFDRSGMTDPGQQGRFEQAIGGAPQGGKGMVGAPVNRVGPMPGLPPGAVPPQAGQQGVAPQAGPQGLMQQQPQQPQLPPYEPPQQYPTSIPSKLFGGPSANQLDPSQQRVASRDAMINAGSAMLERGGPKPYGTPPATLMQQIGAGLRAGSEAYRGTAKGARMANLARQTQEAMGGDGMTRAGLDRLIVGTMTDAPELFQPLAQMRMAMKGVVPSYSEVRTMGEGGKEKVEWVNDADPNDRHLMGSGYEEFKPPVYRRFQNEEGIEEMHIFDPDLYWEAKNDNKTEAEAVKAATVPLGLYPWRRMTEMASRASFHLPIVLGSAQYFDPYMNEAPKWHQQMIDDLPQASGARQFMEQEMQKVEMAAIAYADAWLRQVTGAAYKTEELEAAKGLFMPEFGDKPGTLQAKARNRALLETMLRTRAADRRMSASDWQQIMEISHEGRIFSVEGEKMRRAMMGRGTLTQDQIENMGKNTVYADDDLAPLLGPGYEQSDALTEALEWLRQQDQAVRDSVEAANR